MIVYAPFVWVSKHAHVLITHRVLSSLIKHSRVVISSAAHTRIHGPFAMFLNYAGFSVDLSCCHNHTNENNSVCRIPLISTLNTEWKTIVAYQTCHIKYFELRSTYRLTHTFSPVEKERTVSRSTSWLSTPLCLRVGVRWYY